MGLDHAILDREPDRFTVQLERGHIRRFANAIGADDPVHLDPEAARGAGHPDLVAPPTFLFGVDLERADTLTVLAQYGVDFRYSLHGEQRFDYHADVHAGDALTFTSRFENLYTKKGGALTFLTRRTEVHRNATELVATMESTTVVREAGTA